MEENKDKLCAMIDREPDGVGNVVENSHVLQVSHVREVSDTPPCDPTVDTKHTCTLKRLDLVELKGLITALLLLIHFKTE